MLFDSAAFTIPTKQQVVDKVLRQRGDQTNDILCLQRANNQCLINRTYRIALHSFYQALGYYDL
ncbi:hypothetical protein MXB_987 [Myxobolus squamalis]|nr:hypothetical protein MXB_987 [Myxobolus squamalis]